MPVNFNEIRQRRTLAKLSLQQAGEAAGLGEGKAAAVRWHNVESGRNNNVRISTLEAVASVLGCLVQDLLTTPAPKPSQKRRGASGSAGSKARPS